MSVHKLSRETLMVEKKTSDPNTIKNLDLTHKVLVDVSCLADFKNLERLDLGFNNLTSLQGLKDCINLKWLSVIENKLHSLDGIQPLTKLLVLNAGKNKIRSMEGVMCLHSLGACILNDNQIDAICPLDQLHNLNTIVLSRNPIGNIGKSLANVKSLTKVSLSKCQLDTVDSSLKLCTELKELRLSHNKFTTIPTELVHNKNLQNLDLGNNLITSWASLKVLESLVNLRNLNLQGNPIAEKEKLGKKIRKLLPNLQIFNGRPTDENIKVKKRERIIKVDDSVLAPTVAHELKVAEEEKRNNSSNGDKKSEDHDDNRNNENADIENKMKQKRPKTDDNELDLVSKEDSSTLVGKDSTKKSKKLEKRSELDAIDDRETPFMDLFSGDNDKEPEYMKGFPDAKASSVKNNEVVVKIEKNKRKANINGPAAFRLLSSTTEVGMGGSSTWDT